MIELWRTGKETGSRVNERERKREREILSALETDSGFPDALKEGSEIRKENEILSQLFVKSLMWLRGFFFMLCKFEGKTFNVWFCFLLAIGLISLYLLLL